MKNRRLVEEAIDLIAFSLDLRLNGLEQRRRKNDRQTRECQRQTDQLTALLDESGISVRAVPIVDTFKSIFKQEMLAMFGDLRPLDSSEQATPDTSITDSRDSSIRDVDSHDSEAAVIYSPTFVQTYPEDLPPLVSIDMISRRSRRSAAQPASPGPIRIVDERQDLLDKAYRQVMRDSSHNYEDRVETMVALLQAKDAPNSFSFRDANKQDNFDLLLHRTLQS